MFESPITFVIGAGASAEVGLPLGSDLKAEIAKRLSLTPNHPSARGSGDHEIPEALTFFIHELGGNADDFNNYIIAGHQIAEAMPFSISIDNYLDSQRGDARIERCGKLAICRAITEAERRSDLCINPRSNTSRFSPEKIKDAWLVPFLQMATENCHRNDIAACLR
ncbi:MAG: hypothetical protein AB7P12_06955 [Alphaproteobacteria bacterium]